MKPQKRKSGFRHFQSNKSQLESSASCLSQTNNLCPNCGIEGKHLVVVPDKGSFWICPKYHGPDGKRIDTSDMPDFIKDF